MPEGWEWSTLGELFYLQAGKNISANQISETKKDNYIYPCYGGNGLRGYVTNYNKEGLHPLVGRQGALCGNVNISSHKFYATEHAVVVDTFAKTDFYWCVYSLLQLNLNQYATATAQPGLSVNKINEVLIPLPPLAEQNRISANIERWFALIDKLETNQVYLQNAIKQAKAKILDLAIHGKLVPQDPNDEPAIEIIKRINPDFTPCDNSHYPFVIPKTWLFAPIKEMFDLNPKSNLDDKEEVGFIPMALVQEGYSGKHSFERREWSLVKKGFCHFTNGDIGIAKISPCFENRKSVVFRNLPNGYGAGTTELTILRGKKIDPEFFLLLFKSDWYISEGTQNYKGVVGQQRVSKDIFTTIRIPIPPIAEQQRIVSKKEELFSILDAIQNPLEA